MASTSGGDDNGDGGGRPQRQRHPSAKARDMEGIDLNRIIESLSKGEEVEEAAASSAKKRSGTSSNSKRAVVGESDSDSDGWDSEPDAGENEEDNSDKEERTRKAKAWKKRQELKDRLGLRSEWRRDEDGKWFLYEPKLPTNKRWCMDNFSSSEPSPLLHTIVLDSLLVRDLFIKPGLLSPDSDLPALGFTCKALTPLLGATAINPSTTSKRFKKGLAPTFVEGGGEAEVTVVVDFNTTGLAFPTRFVAGLGRPHGQVITHLTLLNLTGELCYELAEVINGPGLPNLLFLSLGGDSVPFKATNDKNGGLLPSIFTASRDKTPRLTALSLEDFKVSANTWKRTAALIRKTLSPALKIKRTAVLAPPPKPDATDTPDNALFPAISSSSTTNAPAPTATPAPTAIKHKAVVSTTGKTKKPRTSSAAKAKKKGGKGKTSKKTKTPAAAVKTLPRSAAPSPLLRCTELRLSGGVRLPKGVLVDLLLGWQRFGTPLTVLVLEDTRVDERELKFLAQTIEAFPTLAVLGVAEQALTATTAAALIDGLAAHGRAVTALSLRRLGWQAWHYQAPPDTHMVTERLVAAGKGVEEGGSGPGLASSLELLDISWPALTDSDRDALMECLFGDAPAFPALKTLRFTRMPTFRAHVLRILEACLRGGITDIDLSYNGGSKEAVKAMVAEAKATIPTLGLPHDQPVKLNLIQDKNRWHWAEKKDAEAGLNGEWEVIFCPARTGWYWWG